MDFFQNVQERYVEGIISLVNDDSVIIDLKMGMGIVMLPKKYIVSDGEVKEGQVVGFFMSFPEVVFDGVDDNHVRESKKKVMSLQKNVVKAAS